MDTYFVNYYLHNADNDGWAYKVVGKYTSFTAAKKAYHTQLADLIGVASYDSVAVTLTDASGKPLMAEHDVKPVEIAPEVNE